MRYSEFRIENSPGGAKDAPMAKALKSPSGLAREIDRSPHPGRPRFGYIALMVQLYHFTMVKWSAY